MTCQHERTTVMAVTCGGESYIVSCLDCREVWEVRYGGGILRACKCDHSKAQHTDKGECRVPGCGCVRYRPFKSHIGVVSVYVDSTGEKHDIVGWVPDEEGPS